jgi:hypothetical protein
MMYNIYIRDRNLNRVAEVKEYNKFEVTLNFNDVGKWVLTMPDGTPEAKAIRNVRAQGLGLGGIVVERNNEFLFSGPIRNIRATADWLDDDGDTLIVEGTDDNGLLVTRLAMPPPYIAQAGTGIGYDEFLGPAESAMIRLVTKNMIEPPQRRIPGVTVSTDQERGSNITIRSRYHTLLEKLQEAGRYDDLGFRLIQKETSLLFEVYEPQNKVQSVVFSRERGNLGGYDYAVNAPAANFVIGGGQGEEEARIFAYAGDEPSRALYGTIEAFDDQRNVPTQAELVEIILNDIVEMTEDIRFEFQPLETINTRFMRDYQIGDRVTVEIEGEVIQDLIRGVTIQVDTNDETITPVIGTPGVGTSFRLFDKVRNLEGRIGRIEKR